MIFLNKCEKDVLMRFNKLKAVLPAFMVDSDSNQDNPFIAHIEKKKVISEELLDFLEHSEFLQNLTRKSVEYSIKFYDAGCGVEWFNFLQIIFDQDGEQYSQLYDYVYIGYKAGISLNRIQNVFDTWNGQNVKELKDSLYLMINQNITEVNIEESFPATMDKFKEDEREYINQLKDDYNTAKLQIVQLEKEKTILVDQLNDSYEKLEKAYFLSHEDQRTILDLKLQVAKLLKKIGDYEKFSEELINKNAEYLAHISQIEKNESDDIVVENVSEESESSDDTTDSLTINNQIDEVLGFGVSDGISSIENHENAVISEKDESENLEDSFVISNIEENQFDEQPERENNIISYENVSFAEEEVEEVFTNEENSEPEEIEYEDVSSINIEAKSIKECGMIFNQTLMDYCKERFEEKASAEKQGIIFMKLRECGYSLDETRFVKEKIKEFDLYISYFELFELISKNVKFDELKSFFSNVKFEAAETEGVL